MADLYFTNYIYNYLYFNIIKECSNIYNIRRRVVAGLLGFESHGSHGGKFILSHNGPCRWVSRAGHGRQAPFAKLRNHTSLISSTKELSIGRLFVLTGSE